jgi:ribosomal protein L44E
MANGMYSERYWFCSECKNEGFKTEVKVIRIIMEADPRRKNKKRIMLRMKCDVCEHEFELHFNVYPNLTLQEGL